MFLGYIYVNWTIINASLSVLSHKGGLEFFHGLVQKISSIVYSPEGSWFILNDGTIEVEHSFLGKY